MKSGQLNDERPAELILDTPTMCCGSLVIIQHSGTFRCPCGKRQENIAKETLLRRTFPRGMTTQKEIEGKGHLYKTAKLRRTEKFVQILGYDNGNFRIMVDGKPEWVRWVELEDFCL